MSLSMRAFLDQFKANAAGTGTSSTMTAQSPDGSGTALHVPAPTMTPSGPILSAPKAADLTPSIPVNSPALAPQAPAAAGSPAPAPSVNPQPAPAATAAFTPPAGAAPGATAPASSAAALSLQTAGVGAPPAGPVAPIQPATPKVTGTGAGAVQSTALTGAEAPKTIDPTVSASLQSLLERAQAAVGRSLDQPTVWDDTLADQIKAQEKRGIDENYTQQGDALNSELASRGLNWSSIAGDRVTDLATRKAQALGDVDTNIARERANALAAGRASGLSAVQSLIGTQSGIERGVQNDARTERDYTDATADKAYNQSLNEYLLEHSLTMQDQNAWQDAVQQGLNYGAGSAGTTALGTAGSINNATGAAYGGNASADNAQLQTLAQLAMQFFGSTGGK